jgi:myo-inositol-1(or 4)-monophosphatase
MTAPAELRALAAAVAVEAGAFILDGLSRVRSSVASKSSPTDLVTEMDVAAEALVVGRLLTARPADGVLGEEGASGAGTSGIRWIVDPIDGTTNYVYGLPAFAVSIAAEVDGTVVAGAVAVPALGEIFSAAAGAGATCNDLPIRAASAVVLAARDDGLGADARLARTLLATGYAYDPARRGRQAAVIASVLPRVRDVRRMGAAAVDLCLVAAGRVDAFYEQGLQPWDYAAGALIAREAGAVVTDLDGGPPSTSSVLAAPADLHGPLRDLLLAAGARSS